MLALARFVQSADHLVRQLDSAAAISSHRWPLVPELRVLELQRLDVRAIAAGYGEDGVRVDELTAGTLEHLEPAVRAHDAGDLDPWRRSREEVRGILAGLRDLLVEPQLDGGVETRAAPAGPPTTTATPAPVQANVEGGRKGGKAEKPPRRRRPGTGNPNGRPSKDADELLRRVIRQITDEARRDALDVERELFDRIYSRTAEELCEMILQRLRKRIAASTVRSSSELWKRWAKLRKAKGKPARSGGGGDSFQDGEINVGGAKPTADDRRCDAATAAWAEANGISLDDDGNPGERQEPPPVFDAHPLYSGRGISAVVSRS